MFQSEMKTALLPRATRQAVRAATRRCGFSPEALETLERIMDDVWSELCRRWRRLATAPCASGSRGS